MVRQQPQLSESRAWKQLQLTVSWFWSGVSEVFNAFYSESENWEWLKFRALVAVTFANLAARGGVALFGVSRVLWRKMAQSHFFPFCFLLIYATNSKITEPDQTASLPVETSKLPVPQSSAKSSTGIVNVPLYTHIYVYFLFFFKFLLKLLSPHAGNTAQTVCGVVKNKQTNKNIALLFLSSRHQGWGNHFSHNVWDCWRDQPINNEE